MEPNEPISFIDSLHVSSESIKGPFFMILYGPANCGKSGMCLNAPDPFYVSLESGTDWIPAPKFTAANKRPILPENVDQFFDMLNWIGKSSNRKKLDQPVKTIVIDSLGFFETLVYERVIQDHPMTEGKKPKKVESIVDLGYDGMGYTMDYWHRLLAAVKQFKARGLNVIMITHSAYINVTAPSGQSYKELAMALQIYGKHNVVELLSRACDYCYFMNSETEIVQVGKGTWSKNVAVGTHSSATIVTTRKTPLFFAKTRPIDETKIPDVYLYDLDSRADIQKQIFNDILEA